VVETGVPLGQAPVVVIMVHGRNAGPANILDLVPRLARPNVTYLAPTAAGRTWYPLGFMADVQKNEPDLSSALELLESVVARAEAAGVPRSHFVMLGFSQGACLTAEFAVRHPSRFGGFILFTGGVIGPPGTEWNHPGNFEGTPMFLGSGDPDSHVPVSRVLESAALFTSMGASVAAQIYPSRGHWVSDDEIAAARKLLDRVTASASKTDETAASARFTSEWQRARVVFGAGARKALPAEIDRLGVKRVLIVTTPGRTPVTHELAGLLLDQLAGVCALAVQHVPRESIVGALAEVDRLAPDAVAAIGGGSAIGLAKAIALERGLPLIAVPTTYAGSEMTSIYGITEAAEKRTGRHPRVAPRLVLYDPELTLSLPANVSAASGMNAVAHAVEAMYAADASPIATASAAEAIRALSHALPLIVANPGDLVARTLALRGAHAAGVSLELAAMGLHHKICHVLGGAFGLPHAETHAVMLPHVAAFNAPAAPDAMAHVAAALGVGDAIQGLQALNRTLGLPASLLKLGFQAADIPRAADLVASASYPNPRPASATDVRNLLSAAL
jgi:maleylacetate reductase